MDLSELHFAQPLWLFAGVAIPLVWIVYFLFYRIDNASHHLEKFIDKHLLPYLLMNNSNGKSSFWKPLLLWTIVWSLLTLGLAGPRWDFREMETFSKDQSLVILLDLSESMNATDIKPSRLVRAKQKIEDILNVAKGVKIGLIAFAADPHMVTPVTEDIETIRHLLPTLDTDLIYVQGSRLSTAFDMASSMLESEPGNNKAILVISDGGFEDASAIVTAKKIAEKGIIIHAMGVGTAEGAPIRDHEGNVIKKNGAPLLSKLEKERFKEISKSGNGRYLEAHYSADDERIILSDLEKRSDAERALGKKSRLWDERFYLLIFPALPLLLWWFRRGSIFVLIFLFLTPFHLSADAADYFKNSEQQGKEAMDGGDYQSAANSFQDPYRKGVACYRAGNFAEAEILFRQSERKEVACSAAYNLGNSLVQQQKLKEAIVAYEDVLKDWPEHTNAKENLELVKKMLEQQKQDSSNSDEKEDKEGEDKKEQSKDGSENESKNDKDNDSQDSEGKNGSDNKDQHQDHDSKNSRDENKPQSKKEPEAEAQESNPDKLNESQESEQNQSNEKDSPQDSTENRDAKAPKSQEDQDADLWLNRLHNDPKMFMRNKFYIESKKNGTTEGIDPW